MGDAAKKIAGLLLMMCSVFLLLGGLYSSDEMAAKPIRTLLILAGLTLLIAGFILYRLTKHH